MELRQRRGRGSSSSLFKKNQSAVSGYNGEENVPVNFASAPDSYNKYERMDQGDNAWRAQDRSARANHFFRTTASSPRDPVTEQTIQQILETAARIEQERTSGNGGPLVRTSHLNEQALRHDYFRAKARLEHLIQENISRHPPWFGRMDEMTPTTAAAPKAVVPSPAPAN